MNKRVIKERRVNTKRRSPRDLPKRKLGTHGPVVSALGFGCMGLNFGYTNVLDKADAIQLIRDAFEDVIIEPQRPMLLGTPLCLAAASRPRSSRKESCSSIGYGLVSRKTLSVAIPAAVASGLPLSVPA